MARGRQSIGLAAGLALALLSLSAQTMAGEPKILRRWVQSEPETLDPQKSTGVADAQIEQDIYEGLIRFDADKHPTPGVAERWDVSADGLTYVFHLRADAVWSNGDPVTSADFLYSFRRLVDPKTAASDIDSVRDIVNAEEINASKITDPAALGVEAPDPRTFILRLKQVNLILPELLTGRFTYPVHRATVEGHPADWTRPGVAVTNGPFLLKSWTPHDQIELVRNPRYHGSATTNLDGVVHVVSDDDATALKRYLSGDLDITRAPTRQLPALRRDHAAELHTGTARATTFMPFNLKRGPLGTDVRLREALAMTIDREALTQKIEVRGQQPAYSFVPAAITVHGYVPQNFHFMALSQAERVARAKQLLAEAGYGPDHPLKVTLSYTTNDELRNRATAIAQMWKTAIGVETVLENQEFQVLLANLRRQNYEIGMLSFQIDIDDPVQFLRINQTDAGDFNDTGYANPAYDALIKKARLSLDWPGRNGFAQQAERLFIDDVALIPLFSSANNYLVKPRVIGWRNNEGSPATTFLSLAD